MSLLIIDFVEESTNNINRFFMNKGLNVLILSPEDLEPDVPIIGVICTGSEQTVLQKNHQLLPDYIFDLNVPILCICYSTQLIIEKFGGNLKKQRLYGTVLLDDDTVVWVNYTIGVTSIPDKFRINRTFKESNFIASFETDTGSKIMPRNSAKIICLMFHPERRKGSSLYNCNYLESFYQYIISQ